MKKVIEILIIAEWLAAWFTQLAFWHISPPIRDRWVWLLLLPVGFFLLRVALERKMTMPWGMAGMAGLFLAIAAFNFEAAPLRRQEFWVLVCRPLAGLWLILATVRLAQHYRQVTLPALSLMLLAVVGVLLGLTATQWDGKSDLLRPIIDLLPRLDARAVLPDAMLAFNPNELAGALVLLCPLMTGLALWWRSRALSVAAALLAAGLVAALLLGQSRFALAGVAAAWIVMGLLAVGARARRVLLASAALLIVVEVAIVTAAPTGSPTGGPPDTALLSPRDEDSLQRRLDMLQRAGQMLLDHPLTGVGMGMFRAAIRQPAYQIEAFEARNFTAPHAHNLWFHMGADMGVPGLVWYTLLHLMALAALWRLWRGGGRALAVALLGALLGYSVYGLGDAITLWDRLGFVWWAVLALLFAAVQVQDLLYNDAVLQQSEKTTG